MSVRNTIQERKNKDPLAHRQMATTDHVLSKYLRQQKPEKKEE